MVKRITDTAEPCKPYSLNLPESYAALFAKITNKGSSQACRLLITYALEHGALEALAAKPTPARELTDDELRHNKGRADAYLTRWPDQAPEGYTPPAPDAFEGWND